MQDEEYLKKALKLASKRRGFCAPNPAVGAVVVKNNHIISSGEHWGAGHPHAEVRALKSLNSEDIKDAVLYITLEPCCHFGRTPPCTDLIIQSGIKKVVYGFADPDLRVNKQGEEILKKSGIECYQIDIPEINQFYESYAFWQQEKLPFVTAKLAISLDGKIAGKNSERINLTGKAAKQFTHQCRKRCDAILTTANTVVADNPELNIRLPGEEIMGKPVYIIDKNSRVSAESKIFKTASEVKILNKNTQTLSEILHGIAKDGVHDLWVEAGGKLFSSLIQEKLIQQAYIYIAPMTIGKSGLEGFVAEGDLFKNTKSIEWQILDKDMICKMRWV